MKDEIKSIIGKRPITQDDIEGYKGFEYKSDDACIFEQNKCIERDIQGHDSYESYCTRSGELKYMLDFKCSTCKYKMTIQEYKSIT